MRRPRIYFTSLALLAVVAASAGADVVPITSVVAEEQGGPPTPEFLLKSITVDGYTVAVEELVTGTSEGEATAQPAPYNDIGAADNFDLNLFAGRANENPPTWQIRKLGGQLAWVDTNGDNPDFFVFETGGNQPFSIEAILPGGAIGESVQVPQETFGATGLNITTSGPHNGQTIEGVAFAITDLLDADGTPLTNSSVIEGIQISSAGIDPSCFCAVAAPPVLKAMGPDPADGAIGVLVPLFGWVAGSTAALHDIYIGTNPELTADDLAVAHHNTPLYYHLPPLEPGTMYYWRVDEVEADMVTVHTGDVWSFLTQALTAYYPSPADGAVDVSPTPILTWLAGQGAYRHQVYFSEQFDDVNNATAAADKGIQEVANAEFSPGDLGTLITYYWRVDEILAGETVRPGPVWSFTTYLPVEDFESYTDQEGEEIFSTWIDGYDDPVNGSVVGYIDAQNGTYGETTIIHGGTQSMPVEYNNVDAASRSTVDRTWTPAENWTRRDIGMLMLHLRGERSNTAVPLYVKLTDSAGRSALVMHSDPEIVRKTKWTQWRIPLSAFSDANVNVAAVKILSIVIGGPDAAAGGAGRIYIDNVYLTKLP